MIICKYYSCIILYINMNYYWLKAALMSFPLRDIKVLEIETDQNITLFYNKVLEIKTDENITLFYDKVLEIVMDQKITFFFLFFFFSCTLVE